MFKGLRVEHLIFTISMFVCCLGIQSQERNRIDEIVSSYPKNVKTVGEIGTRILSDFNLPQDRARAAFSWIAINISYDKSISEERNSKYAFSYKTEQEKKRKEIAFHDQLLTDVLKSRSAVCDGYSVLFERLCLFLGLESAVIRGTLKSDPSQIGNKELPLNHAWNAVKINGKWELADVTLAAGYISAKSDLFMFDFNEGYFLPAPELLSLSHYPEDSRWLFTDKSRDEFSSSAVYWGNYFRYPYRIKGVKGLTLASESILRLTITTLTQDDWVEYRFGTESEKHEAKAISPSNFEIDIRGKSGSTLHIILNGKTVLTSRIL